MGANKRNACKYFKNLKIICKNNLKTKAFLLRDIYWDNQPNCSFKSVLKRENGVKVDNIFNFVFIIANLYSSIRWSGWMAS